MEVTIASVGRFHAFDLARQMERLGHLDRLYTAYPRFKVDALPAAKVSTFPGSWDPPRSRGVSGCWVCASVGSSHIKFQNEILREEYGRLDIPFIGTDARIVDREIAEYEFCDLISVPSSFAMRSFIEQGVPREKLRLNPYGVNLAMFHPMPKRDSVFRVLFVGSISIRKGIAYLLEAVKRASLPKLDLVLIGHTDPGAKKIIDRYGVALHHPGVLPRAQLAEQYSQASVLVLPSLEEGLALVQAQAMACGVPVIATTNTGAEDLFTDGVEGFVVPIRDPDAIAAKLVYLYEHPEARDAMGAAALARVRGLGGWNSYGEKMAVMYQSALADRTGRERRIVANRSSDA